MLTFCPATGSDVPNSELAELDHPLKSEIRNQKSEI